MTTAEINAAWVLIEGANEQGSAAMAIAALLLGSASSDWPAAVLAVLAALGVCRCRLFPRAAPVNLTRLDGLLWLSAQCDPAGA